MSHSNIVDSEDALAAIVREARTVAVIGMKGESEPDAEAFTIPRMLQQRGLRVIPVNPKLTRALGEPAYASIAAVPTRVDIVDVFRRSEAIDGIADEVLALPPAMRPSVFWMQSGIRNAAAAQRLAEAGLRVVQNHCLGVYAAKYRARI
jgi:predicted CoA-binding protein